jgi:hypothetical protein
VKREEDCDCTTGMGQRFYCIERTSFFPNTDAKRSSVPMDVAVGQAFLTVTTPTTN